MTLHRSASASALALLLALLLACGGDAGRTKTDSAAAPAVASPEGSLSDSASAATSTAAGESTPAASLDSLRKVAHRHPMPHAAAGALSEEIVQGVVDAINAADAQLAAPAVQKATNPEVKRFASRLASAHSQKVTDTPPLKNEAGVLVAPLRELQTQSTARLAGLPAGAPFDRAFIESQVAAHERALAVLDSIRPAAQTGDLPTLVASTRAQVVRHLDEARALQRRLGAP